jgi:hypothetical protein
LSPAQPSDAERARSDGTRVYEDTLRQIARRADHLDQYWMRFRETCYQGPDTAGSERPWLVVLEPRARQDRVPPPCASAYADVASEAAAIRTAVAAAEQAAHGAGVYPGVRRDARRRHRLDHPGLDR